MGNTFRTSSELSPRAGVVVGLLLIASGTALILGALEIIALPLTPGTPVWVGVAAGLVFVLGGAAVVSGYAVGPRGTVYGRIQAMLGAAICALFAAISGWIAFGPGEREFSSTTSLPFLTRHAVSAGWTGRAAFGVGTLMAAAMGIAMLVTGFRKPRN